MQHFILERLKRMQICFTYMENIFKYKEVRFAIPLTSLALPHFCAFPYISIGFSDCHFSV